MFRVAKCNAGLMCVWDLRLMMMLVLKGLRSRNLAPFSVISGIVWSWVMVCFVLSSSGRALVGCKVQLNNAQLKILEF